MVSLLQPAQALIDPAAGVPVAVGARRWVWPLLFLMASVAFSGVAFALRWDASPTVIQKLSEAGELAQITETELEAQIRTAARVALVGGAAKGVFLMPLLVLLGAVAVKFSGWLLSRPLKFHSALSAVAVAMLPIAVFHLAYGAVALSWAQLSLAQAPSLLPSHLGHLLTGLSPELSRLASVVDVFNLWAATLLGLGIAESTSLPRWKGLAWGWALYLAYAGAFLVGLAGMGGGK